uniref:Peptidase C14 caspase domain-containing protein n=1 Tax=Pyrodinium bahamense TaxID=73915 RepID=A0A7S0FAL4_9DINO
MARTATSVLIASSAADGSAGQQGISRRIGGGGAAQPPNTKAGNLSGTISDVALMYRFLTQKLGVPVQKMFADVDTASTNRALVMTAIRAAFDKGCDDVLLYYSGHGKQGDGAWCFEAPGSVGINEFVTPQEVLGAWRGRASKRAGQKLIIISDSCHSGWWVEAAVAEGQQTGELIIVQAACGVSEQSEDTPDGGVFTKIFVKMSHGPVSNWMLLNRLTHPVSAVAFLAGGVAGAFLAKAGGVAGGVALVWSAFAAFTPTCTEGAVERSTGRWFSTVGPSYMTTTNSWSWLWLVPERPS